MRALFLTGMLLITIPGAARADWQYTNWGMTPGQVAAASKGAARVGRGDPGEEYAGAEIGATGAYDSGGYKFRVNFHFTNGQLVNVRLRLLEGEPYGLKNDLLGVYGRPFYEGTRLGLTTWHDTAKNNRIDLVLLGASHTSLEYRPLVDESAAGL